MEKLTVLTDENCGLCRTASQWLSSQLQHVPLELLGLRSGERRRRYPDFEEWELVQDLHVIADDGQLWKGASAWVMVLWALEDYRSWALRLASPTLLPYTETIVKRISRARHSKRLDSVLRDIWWQRQLDRHVVGGSRS